MENKSNFESIKAHFDSTSRYILHLLFIFPLLLLLDILFFLLISPPQVRQAAEDPHQGRRQAALHQVDFF